MGKIRVPGWLVNLGIIALLGIAGSLAVGRVARADGPITLQPGEGIQVDCDGGELSYLSITELSQTSAIVGCALVPVPLPTPTPEPTGTPFPDQTPPARRIGPPSWFGG